MRPHFITSVKSPVFPDNLYPDRTGLVALGGNLSPSTLIEAYSKGIFPWSGEDPIPWFSPDPRLVLFPGNFHVSDRFRRFLKKSAFQVRFDTDFPLIMKKCAFIPRKYQDGTWINERLIKAYSRLFDLHIAHCVGIYLDNMLCGGLYGLSLGNGFFGESMFSEIPDSSKTALYYLTRFCIRHGIRFIDCQQVTPHMLSLGALPIPRQDFLQLLIECRVDKINASVWEWS